jgi:mono/diheme cytochrome c family protein
MKFIKCCICLTSILFITSCINNVEDVTPPDIPPDLPDEVSYSNDVQPIFNSRCTNCHGGTNGVTLTSYETTLNSVGKGYGTNIVVPGKPDESPLIDKIEPDPEIGSRMPTGSSLTNEEISLIRAWISAGAEDN